MCVNLAAVHVVSFCKASKVGDANAYLNAYDVARLANRRVGERRKKVDDALPLPAGQTPASTYFGAAELTGCGVRFYGDVALILRPWNHFQNTTILDRNSFELTCPPVSDEIESLATYAGIPHSDAMRARARAMSGTWSRDLVLMLEVEVSSEWTREHASYSSALRTSARNR
jgi:hypothetical protein